MANQWGRIEGRENLKQATNRMAASAINASPTLFENNLFSGVKAIRAKRTKKPCAKCGGVHLTRTQAECLNKAFSESLSDEPKISALGGHL